MLPPYVQTFRIKVFKFPYIHLPENPSAQSLKHSSVQSLRVQSPSFQSSRVQKLDFASESQSRAFAVCHVMKMMVHDAVQIKFSNIKFLATNVQIWYIISIDISLFSTKPDLPLA